ncbi:DUF58 domain-containing protein [Anaeropeptidivorans aminofermentans]|uniref:DUF58 domain-containing protein n=1 Tax=Anaeropeptidivorans aminofermentans TaxID=2934315 RepID=UPI002023BDDC|nr:DUF58 domain-containing protein [Anaeropeptidivorans aminofermentans]
MTSKFIKILSAGMIPLIILGFINNQFALVFFLLYNLILIGLLSTDRILTPKESVLIIERISDDKLYFKDMNKIEFKVKNIYEKPLKIEIKDDFPSLHFNIHSSELFKTVQPGQEEIFSYELIPSKRGSYVFQNIYLRYHGILGLCKKYAVIERPFEYKVYPNLKNISRYRLIIQKNRLLTAGNRKVSLRGMGTEFESLKEYVEGDDYRKINWMATARENKLIVNQYEAEKNQPVYILIDTGRSMSYSIRGYKKLDFSINAAIILSDIVNQKGDNSGLMIFNTEVSRIIPPGKGDSHRNEIMEALYHIEDTKLSSDYQGAFLELANRQKRRSIVFIFTDFETGEESKELIAAIPILSKRHVPVIITIENESLKTITLSDGNALKDTYNKAMAEELLLNRKNIIRSLNQHGILCIESPAEDFAINTVNQYLLLKQRGSA